MMKSPMAVRNPSTSGETEIKIKMTVLWYFKYQHNIVKTTFGIIFGKQKVGDSPLYCKWYCY